MNNRFLKLGFLLLTSSTVFGQNLDLPYSSGSTGADGAFTVPAAASAISGFGIAYDTERNSIVRFGGQTVAGAQSAQTWINRAADWQGWQIASASASPSTRAFCAMAFDDTRNEVVLFGGLAGSSRMSDTWVWNGSLWSQRSPAHSPPERSHAAMAWDADRQQIVLFGGRGVSGALQDTWVWDGTDWTLKVTVTSPPARVNHSMAPYPPLSKVAMACGNSVDAFNAGTALGDLWLWSGDDWLQTSGSSFPASEAASLVFDNNNSRLLHYAGAVRAGTTTTALNGLTSWHHTGGVASLTSLGARYQHGAVWNSGLKQMVITCGRSTSVDLGDTYAWTGASWLSITYPNYVFDLNSKPEAIWNFTTINVQSGATVSFIRNPANNPVLWLASEGVTINGTISASGGEGGAGPAGSGIGGLGGPGGFDGGPSNQPGKGPGGGVSGESPVSDGKHAGVYGSLFAQPPTGGSGGGGWSAGPGGGGGGGSVVIASSKDIYLNGKIQCKGGPGGLYTSVVNARRAGSGSGGLIRVVADRIILGASGLIDVGGASGRTRLEGYVRSIPDIATQVNGTMSLSVPVVGSILAQAGGRLSFVKVAGENVANPPKGDVINPDVIFTASGTVEIEVHALNVPDGTPVTVTINHSIAGVINLPAVTLQQCKATFTATIPAGQGVMQAFATYNVGGPTGNGAP